MERIVKLKKIWFWVGLLTAISGAAVIPGIVFTAINKKYFLMAICIALAVHTFYGSTFYWVAFGNARISIRVCRAVREKGLAELSQIAAYACLSEKQAEETLRLCFQRGYLNDYMMTDGRISKVMTEVEPKSFRCPYCLGVYSTNVGLCPSCGARVEPVIED